MSESQQSKRRLASKTRKCRFAADPDQWAREPQANSKRLMGSRTQRTLNLTKIDGLSSFFIANRFRLTRGPRRHSRNPFVGIGLQSRSSNEVTVHRVDATGMYSGHYLVA
jgi:hypothetical protein